jgi:hypothetical protein
LGGFPTPISNTTALVGSYLSIVTIGYRYRRHDIDGFFGYQWWFGLKMDGFLLLVPHLPGEGC